MRLFKLVIALMLFSILYASINCVAATEIVNVGNYIITIECPDQMLAVPQSENTIGLQSTTNPQNIIILNAYPAQRSNIGLDVIANLAQEYYGVTGREIPSTQPIGDIDVGVDRTPGFVTVEKSSENNAIATIVSWPAPDNKATLGLIEMWNPSEELAEIISSIKISIK
jgi:hypothetical protein